MARPVCCVRVLCVEGSRVPLALIHKDQGSEKGRNSTAGATNTSASFNPALRNSTEELGPIMPQKRAASLTATSGRNIRQSVVAPARGESVEIRRGLLPRQLQFLLILAATVAGWGAIIALCVLGQPDAATVIGGVWTATCGLLALWKPERGS